MDLSNNLYYDYFNDLSEKIEKDLLARKIDSVRVNSSPDAIQTTSITSSNFVNTSPEQTVDSLASVILNQQFFVWKNGTAGRMTVDTPFGFKGL